MKWRRFSALALTLSLLLCGCHREDKPLETRPLDTEPTASYDWMAGESPVPNRRIGLLRNGVNAAPCAISPSGVYFLEDRDGENGAIPYITYVDNGSDRIIKLCGRADCSHSGGDCNAYVDGAQWICYYRGRLYVMICDDLGLNGQEDVRLVCMEPDGTNRVTVLDLHNFATEHGGSHINFQMFTDGYLFFNVMYWAEIDRLGDGVNTEEQTLNAYCYALDGSMREPKLLENSGGLSYNSGNILMCYSPLEAKHGGAFGSVWDYDPETDSVTYLTDHPGTYGYFDEENCYYFKDGNLYRLDYDTQETDVLRETELEGKYSPYLFPDCIVLAESDVTAVHDKTLYIYNWAFELVDAVKLSYTFQSDITPAMALIMETSERLILTDSYVDWEPLYYIEKSELGTGNAVVHEFQRN